MPGTDDWYIAYHRFAIPGGDGTHRETTIDRLDFNADGTIQKVVPTLESIDPLAYEGAEPNASVSDAGLRRLVRRRRRADAHRRCGRDSCIQYRIGDGAWTTYDAPVPLEAGSYAVDYRAQGSNLRWSEARA